MNNVKLEMRQGDSWQLQLNWYNPIPGTNPVQPDMSNPVDMTGYQATLQVYDTTVMLLLTSSPAAGLTVNGPAGQLNAYATPTQTLAVADGMRPWAVEVDNGTDKYTLAAGWIRVFEEVVP